MVTVFSVYLSGFYTHLNAITIENFPLNMVIKNHTHLYRLFRKWITRHVTFNWHQLYIILKFTVFSVHLNGFYTHLNAITIEKVTLNILPFPVVNNSSRDFSIVSNLILFWSLPSS